MFFSSNTLKKKSFFSKKINYTTWAVPSSSGIFVGSFLFISVQKKLHTHTKGLSINYVIGVLSKKQVPPPSLPITLREVRDRFFDILKTRYPPPDHVVYSSEARPKAERSSELGWQKKKWTKEKAPRLDDDDEYHQFCTWSNYSPSCRSFCLSLPLSTSKNFFLCFQLPQSIQKTFWENNFRKKVFLKKKKKSNKTIHFFFSNFFSLSKTYSTPFSFYFIVIHLFQQKKDRKNASLDQYILMDSP